MIGYTIDTNPRKYKIGEKFKNNHNLEFEVINYSQRRDYRVVKFLESGYITECRTDKIKDGGVRDIYDIKVQGVGIMDLKNGASHFLYGRWTNMLSRCYNKKSNAYKTYGALGVTVCNEWLTFSNYVKDIEQKENYKKMVEKPMEWCIDKDTLIQGNKCYKNDTTCIIKISDNSKERMNRCGNPNKKIKIKGE